MAAALFWTMLEHLQLLHPGFGARRRPRFAFRFKRLIHVVDSTTIQLVARCLDWAKHRRRKTAAKGHVRLNLQTFLPRFALVDTAGNMTTAPISARSHVMFWLLIRLVLWCRPGRVLRSRQFDPGPLRPGTDALAN
jgi:hypothetical protein